MPGDIVALSSQVQIPFFHSFVIVQIFIKHFFFFLVQMKGHAYLMDSAEEDDMPLVK